MKYEEVVRYIEDIPKFTKKHTLLHTREFMRRLGNPCQGRKVLHVAGTNGKGSVCAYMQAILLFEGKRVGFFTSPHLVKLNERIRINGKDIDDDTFCRIFAKVRQVAEELEKEGLEHPSYFEFLYGMGMLAFEENDAEYIVLETGLGGRLDATNSFEHPFLSVITSIGLDHTEILGDTIEKIAGEKAGIIKKGVPVFFDRSDERSSRVIEETAENGKWVKGPGMKLFKSIKDCKDLHIIAEDLGFLTPAVHKLLKQTGFPGMKILQFGFDKDGDSPYAPHNYLPNCIVYTGTHDNPPIRTWFETLDKETKHMVSEYVNLTSDDKICDRMVRLALSSVANIAIIPIQDYLGLGLESRINTPSTSENNWQWRLDEKYITKELADYILFLTRLYRRTNFKIEV